ncbi:site-specific integrase [Paenibacillus sp. JTLBN-2024]
MLQESRTRDTIIASYQQMLNSSVFHNIQLYSDHPTLELAAFGLMLCLGLRIHEVANIRYQDINVENRTISVFGKNEKSAILPLPDPLQNYFQKLVVNKGQDVHLFGNNSQSTIRKLRAQYKLYSFVSGWKYPGAPFTEAHFHQQVVGTYRLPVTIAYVLGKA